MNDNFTVLLHGIQTRGTGGVLYVNFHANTRGYLFPNEFKDATFRSSLQTMIDDQGHDAFFIVEERDSKLHVLAYPREVVERAAAAHVLASECPRADVTEEENGNAAS